MFLGLGMHLLAHPLARHLQSDLHEIAHDALHVAADIADLGELRCLDLQKGGLRQAGEAPRDLGLAAAGRPNHQDVFRQHLLAEALVQLLPAPAVAQGDSNRPLCRILADDETVELGDDLSRGQGGHDSAIVSKTILVLV